MLTSVRPCLRLSASMASVMRLPLTADGVIVEQHVELALAGAGQIEEGDAEAHDARMGRQSRRGLRSTWSRGRKARLDRRGLPAANAPRCQAPSRSSSHSASRPAFQPSRRIRRAALVSSSRAAALGVLKSAVTAAAAPGHGHTCRARRAAFAGRSRAKRTKAARPSRCPTACACAWAGSRARLPSR